MDTDTVIAISPYLLLIGYLLLVGSRSKGQKLAHLTIAITYFLILGWLWRYRSAEGRALAFWFYFAAVPTLLPRETRNVLFEISKWLVLSHLLATGSLKSFLTRNLLSLEGSSGV